MELKAPSILSEPLCDAVAVAEALGVSPRIVLTRPFQERTGIVPVVLGPRLTRFRPADVRRAAGEVE